MENGTVTLFRYNPEADEKPYYETHEFPFEAGMSVLDVATYIYENIDGSFSFSACCRNSHCGLCAARINGRPGLMCRETATRELKLDPLDNLSVVRDLVLERHDYDRCMGNLRLFLDRVSLPQQQPEWVDPADHERFKRVSRCVACYACVSVCPSFRKKRHEFLGPAGFVQLARHTFDPRDELDRSTVAFGSGIFNCILCGKCAEVCPHGISPRDSIDMLRDLMKERIPAPEGDRDEEKG